MGKNTTIDLPPDYVPVVSTRSRTKSRPSKETQDSLLTICAFCVFPLLIVSIIGLLNFGLIALLERHSFLNENGPSFYLKSVSVSSPKLSNDSQQQIPTLEWFLNFDVDIDYSTSFDTYQYMNVSVHYLTGTSSVSVIPPLPNRFRNYLTATVRAPLPSFNNVTYVEVSFDVHVQAKIKYKNWLHIYPKKHRDGITNAICKGMRIGIHSDTMHGTLVGGPYRCYDG